MSYEKCTIKPCKQQERSVYTGIIMIILQNNYMPIPQTCETFTFYHVTAGQKCRTVLKITVSMTRMAISEPTIPLPRFSGGATSATMAVLREMFPLLIPAMTRAITKMANVDDTAHSAYDIAIPTCNNPLMISHHTDSFKI